MMSKIRSTSLGAMAIAVAMVIASPAWANAPTETAENDQGNGVSAAPGDIIVTARKRQETQLDVPVIEQVVSAETLARQQTLDLKDLTRLAPGLMIGTAVLSIGQQATLRGVGTSSFDPGIDQSVSLNIDGLSLGQGLAFGSGMFDVAQVEVLKGPQSLFYGKSSTGGVIAIHTADPTDELEVKGTAGYEAEAHTKRFEGVLSGPLSDTLKARIAGFYSKTDGYYYNNAVVESGDTFVDASGVTRPVSAVGGLTPQHDRTGYGRNYMIRGTVIWEPTDRFNAKLKVSYVNDKSFYGENGQLKNCPNGISGVPEGNNAPFINPSDNCRLDRVGYTVAMNPANYIGVSSPDSFVASRQIYGTLEMNFNLTDGLTATSVTGYYDLHSHSVFNTSFAGFAGPAFAVENPRFRRHDFTEELRIATDLPGPFNAMLGGFYQKGHVSDPVLLRANSFFIPAAASGIPLQSGLSQFSIETYSAFGQVRYKIVPTVEIAGGVRVTTETRRQDPKLFPSLTSFGNGQISPVTGPSVLDVPAAVSSIGSTRASPELTITWKPTPDLNIFGSYKIAYKSGSFSIATPPTFRANGTYLDNSFGDEKVSGFEGGIKGRAFDNQLSFALGAYAYKYAGLQVGGIEPTVGSVPVIRTVNAGSGRSKGMELEAHFSPRDFLLGLTLNGAINYSHARFKTLNNIPCYGGQTVAAGCNQQFTPADPTTSPGGVTVGGVYGFYFAQDLSGAPFLRAPDWNGNFGFDYELPLANGWKLTASNNNYVTSRFLTAPGLRSDFWQKGYMKVDASLTLAGRDDRWEIAVIGKNITKKYTSPNCSPSNYRGGLLGGEITGGTGVGSAGTDAMICYMDPGRELWIRLTLRPFG
jgi:iron complex outermembrane receptor protein